VDPRAFAFTEFIVGAVVKIRREQFDAIAAGWSRIRRASYVARLRDEIGTRLPTSAQELERRVDEGCKAAARLGLTVERDVYRFLRLMFVDMDTAGQRPGVQELTWRVLTDSTLDGAKRLDFLEHAVFGASFKGQLSRPVSEPYDVTDNGSLKKPTR
jgi:hypothetical protein